MLAYSLLEPQRGDVERYMLFLHGILGTRANWRGIARRVVDERPGWGAALVDLREHGDSLGQPPPHTLHAAAADVAALSTELDAPVAGAVGHSFGGKVVLEWLRTREGEDTEAWIVDASPSVTTRDRDGSAASEVLRILGDLPSTWPGRAAFVDAIVQAGQPEAIGHWLAMNLRRTDDGGRVFGPDLSVIRALLEDYARTDSWDVVSSPPSGTRLDFVIGGRSDAFSREDRERLQRVCESEPRVRMHVIAEAGHWVHVDAPDELVALLTT